jgi:hypothetical protein
MTTLIAITEEEFYEKGSSGRVLTFAESAVAQSGIVDAQIDGLSMVFDVKRRPVMVESYSPVVYASAIDTNILMAICDEFGNIKAQTGFFFSNLVDARQVIVKERISIPGTYIRRLHCYRSSGTGLITHGITDPITKAYLRAMEC